LEKWVKHIAQIIKNDFYNNSNLVIWPNSTNTIVDIPFKGKSTIYLGTYQKNTRIITGELAHEIAEIKLDSEKLHEKIYYKIILKLTKSYQKTKNYSFIIALISKLIYKNETKADQLGYLLLKETNLDETCMLDYLIWLNNQKNKNYLLSITTKKRLQTIKTYFN
jgi:hypothetical protein